MCNFGMGGGIPLMGMLQKIWPDRPFLIGGVLGPLSNAHGPNEFLHLSYAKKLTCTLAYVVSKCGEHHSKTQQ
jgi:acetylornithine deacetylase/succinyl-diaminopimelate desuccinylase-like protein